jgi:hypothetical protein
MDPADYKKQLTDALVELAKVEEQLDQSTPPPSKGGARN